MDFTNYNLLTLIIKIIQKTNYFYYTQFNLITSRQRAYLIVRQIFITQ